MLTLVHACVCVCNHHPLSENPEHLVDLRPVCCGPVEKKQQRFICLSLIVTARQSSRTHFSE